MYEYIFLAAIGIALLAFRVLDLTATVLTLLIAGIIWQARGFAWFFILFSFFCIAYGATLLRNLFIEKKHEKRGLDNLISNALVAFMASIFGFEFAFVFLGGIAAALSDTLSSEIGMLSRKNPRMITDLSKVVPKGTNGGISLLGVFAAVIGGFCIGILAVIFSSSFFLGTYGIQSRALLFIAVLSGGVVGSLFDSFLGAVLENRDHMSKGSVNFAATLVGGLTTAAIMIVPSLL
jgi:uncharacterized protein (TIGR00297 family)